MYAKYIETIIHNVYLILFYFLVSIRVMRTFAPGGIPFDLGSATRVGGTCVGSTKSFLNKPVKLSKFVSLVLFLGCFI